MAINFKDYVRMSLKESNEKAKNQKEDETSEDEDEDDENTEDEAADEESEDEDSDDEEEASVKDDVCPKCGKKPCVCTKGKASVKQDTTGKEACVKENHLREEMQSYFNRDVSTISEETKVLCESIKNNSASKFLSKLASKAEREAARYAGKDPAKSKQAKKVASDLKEASNKLYKCESNYQAGDPTAKREYKKICKQYSQELKQLGRTSKGIKKVLAITLAGAVLLGAVGLTSASNDAIIEKLSYGFKNPDKLPKILGDMAKSDAQTIKNLAVSLKDSGTKEHLKANLGIDYADAKERAKQGAKDFAKNTTDWAAQEKGYKSAAEQKEYEKFGKAAGEVVNKGKKAIKGAKEGFTKSSKGFFSGFGRGVRGE